MSEQLTADNTVETKKQPKTPEEVALQVGRIAKKLVERASNAATSGVEIEGVNEETGNELILTSGFQGPNGKSVDVVSADELVEHRVSSVLNANGATNGGAAKKVVNVGSIDVIGVGYASPQNGSIELSGTLDSSMRVPNSVGGFNRTRLDTDQSVKSAADTFSTVRNELAVREQNAKQSQDAKYNEILGA